MPGLPLFLGIGGSPASTDTTGGEPPARFVFPSSGRVWVPDATGWSTFAGGRFPSARAIALGVSITTFKLSSSGATIIDLD